MLQGGDFDFVDRSSSLQHAAGAGDAIQSDVDTAGTFIDDEDLPFSVVEFGSGDDIGPLPDSAGLHPAPASTVELEIEAPGFH